MREKQKILKKLLFILFITAILFSVTSCSKGNISEKSTIASSDASTSKDAERTWQEMCLDEKVFCKFSYLYSYGGTFSDLERYYNELTESFENDNTNLFVEKFKEEYEKLNYPSMSQLEKDIINGLIFAEADGKGYISFDNVESAWILTYEDTPDSLDLRTIALQSNIKHYEDTYLMLHWWNKEYSNGSLSEYHKVYTFRGNPTEINFAPLDVAEVNKIIQSNKEFLSFMAEYIDIHTDKKVEIYQEEERIKKEKKSRQPAIGMEKDEVLEGAWGKPNSKNITEDSSGTHEQWVYGNGKYIYFDNGVVTSIQKTE